MPADAGEGMIYLQNAVEANLLEAILREAGIAHFIKAYRDPAFKGSWSFVDAWGHVECPPEHARGVRQILEDLRDSGAKGEQ
jgi:hypothetical protein